MISHNSHEHMHHMYIALNDALRMIAENSIRSRWEGSGLLIYMDKHSIGYGRQMIGVR